MTKPRVRKTRLYRIDVRIYATAYIKATSAAAARTIAVGLKDHSIEVAAIGESEVEISGLRFDNPDLPNVSLSPVMTIAGPDADSAVERADD